MELTALAKNTQKNHPWLWRVPIMLLIILELLVILHIFDIQPDFTKFGLLFTSVTVLFLLEIPYYLAIKRSSRHFYWWALLPAVLAVLLDAGGDLMHFYSRFTHYDTLMHFLGSLAAAVYIWNFFIVLYDDQWRNGLFPRWLLYFLIFTTTVTFGVFYELEEFLEDHFMQSSRFGDGPDTGTDLLMDMLGGLTVMAIIAAHRALLNKRSNQLVSTNTATKTAADAPVNTFEKNNLSRMNSSPRQPACLHQILDKKKRG